MSNPGWNPETMKSVAWALQVQGFARQAGAVSDLATRCQSEGPFFDLTLTQMRQLSRSLGNAGDALNRLGSRLLAKAEEELAQRAFEARLAFPSLRDLR
jgi:hypothetical protein